MPVNFPSGSGMLSGPEPTEPKPSVAFRAMSDEPFDGDQAHSCTVSSASSGKSD
jgi:hypothetical protein